MIDCTSFQWKVSYFPWKRKSEIQIWIENFSIATPHPTPSIRKPSFDISDTSLSKSIIFQTSSKVNSVNYFRCTIYHIEKFVRSLWLNISKRLNFDLSTFFTGNRHIKVNRGCLIRTLGSKTQSQFFSAPYNTFSQFGLYNDNISDKVSAFKGLTIL